MTSCPGLVPGPSLGPGMNPGHRNPDKRRRHHATNGWSFGRGASERRMVVKKVRPVWPRTGGIFRQCLMALPPDGLHLCPDGRPGYARPATSAPAARIRADKAVVRQRPLLLAGKATCTNALPAERFTAAGRGNGRQTVRACTPASAGASQHAAQTATPPQGTWKRTDRPGAGPPPCSAPGERVIRNIIYNGKRVKRSLYLRDARYYAVIQSEVLQMNATICICCTAARL